jgi:DNA-binding transcriptional ArsR family regulator
MSIISPKIHAKSTTKTMRVAARDRAAAHGATAPILRSRLTLDDAQARARVMKALGHSARLQILDLLDQGDLCLCELHPLFKMRQPTLSRHIAVLKQAGIITERRAGPRLILHLATPCILRSFDCAMEVVQHEHARRSRAQINNPA